MKTYTGPSIKFFLAMNIFVSPCKYSMPQRNAKKGLKGAGMGSFVRSIKANFALQCNLLSFSSQNNTRNLQL